MSAKATLEGIQKVEIRVLQLLLQSHTTNALLVMTDDERQELRPQIVEEAGNARTEIVERLLELGA